MFNTLNKHGDVICIEEFKDGVRQLENSNVIFMHDKDRDAYFINHENMECNTSKDDIVFDDGNEDFVTTDEYNLSDDILKDIKKHVEEECKNIKT